MRVRKKRVCVPLIRIESDEVVTHDIISSIKGGKVEVSESLTNKRPFTMVEYYSRSILRSIRLVLPNFFLKWDNISWIIIELSTSIRRC